MTLDEFRKTGRNRYSTHAEGHQLTHRQYLDGLVIDRINGRWVLTIANTITTGPRVDLEATLYQWASDEGFWS